VAYSASPPINKAMARCHYGHSVRVREAQIARSRWRRGLRARGFGLRNIRSKLWRVKRRPIRIAVPAWPATRPRQPTERRRTEMMDIAIVGTKHKEPNKAEGFEHAGLDFENNRRNYGASNAVRFVALFVRGQRRGRGNQRNDSSLRLRPLPSRARSTKSTRCLPTTTPSSTTAAPNGTRADVAVQSEAV